MAPESGCIPFTSRYLHAIMSTKPHPVEEYFNAVSLILSRGAGVPETPYYPALSAMLNKISGRLAKPKGGSVRTLLPIADTPA